MKAKRKIPSDPRGPCELEVTIRHNSGGSATAHYVAPGWLWGEAIFQIVTGKMRELCDVTQELAKASRSIEAAQELRGSGGILFADLRGRENKSRRENG